jgi:hypothetical protein
LVVIPHSGRVPGCVDIGIGVGVGAVPRPRAVAAQSTFDGVSFGPSLPGLATTSA